MPSKKPITSEVRVQRRQYKGREVVDIRLWYIAAGSTKASPSRKGLTMDAGKLPQLLDRLLEMVD
jgi:hypothetical protein